MLAAENETAMNSANQFYYLGNRNTITTGKEGTDPEQLLTCDVPEDNQPSSGETLSC